MSFEAHDAPPFGVPDETFDAAGITVQLSLGPLGTLRSGTLGLAELPAGWEGRAWPRMIRTKLESEHGTGYIAAGIAQAAIRERGALSGVPLTGIETAFLGRPGSGGAALDGGGLTPGGSATYGVAMPTPGADLTREEAINRALEPFPNSEAGVAADLTGIIGRPEAATPAVYTVDARAQGCRSLGWTVTNYVSDARLPAAEGWPARVWSRSDVPPFAPRRVGEATVTPRTVTAENIFAPPPFESGFNLRYPMTGAARRWIIYPQADIAQQQGPLQTVRIEATYQVEIDTNPIIMTLFLASSGLPTIAAPVEYRASGVYQMTWDVALNVALRPNLSATLEAFGTGGGYVTLTQFRRVAVVGLENTAGIVMPYGWDAPFVVGPTFEFTLPGVHVPPFLVEIPEHLAGVPGGLIQHAAGAVITSNRGDASTKILTAALPYPGQRRGV
ncbi:hypothetical protein ASF71_07700 [Deinococcus sp. Leaf326]|nr:hypothetical protein ASF71_07700 [Deinococcus sp. Leaf326]